MSDLIKKGIYETPTDVLIASTEEAEDAEFAITIFGKKDGSVQIRWSNMHRWTIKGLVMEAYDLIDEEEEDE